MRANAIVFWIIFVFFIFATGLYTVWNLIEHGTVEWVGTVALLLTALMGGFIAFYLGRTISSQNGTLPEDRVDANIDDGDPELGFFSPWSWWPVMLAGGAALFMLGLAAGFWICIIAVPLALLSIVGWTYEYYRGYHAR